MTDERDTQVSRRYRELGAEEPPRALDDAILSAARQATDKPHAPLVTPVGRHRWYYGVAAAAVVVLAVAVTLHVERQQPDEFPALPAPSAPPAEVKAPAPAEPPAEPKAAPAAAKPKPRASPAPQPRAAAPAPASEPAPAPTPAPQSSAPASAPELAAGRAADAMSERRERAEAAAEAPTMAKSRAAAPPAASAQRAPAPAAVQRPAETPEQVLERIAELRRQEKHEEADRALEEFRKRYPDYKIPGAMLDKVERR
jgi:hypothetical protein